MVVITAQSYPTLHHAAYLVLSDGGASDTAAFAHISENPVPFSAQDCQQADLALALLPAAQLEDFCLGAMLIKSSFNPGLVLASGILNYFAG